MATQDFWPTGLGEGMLTPVVLMREQASLLGPKVNQLVRAEVSTHAGPNPGEFVHLFIITVPSLGNYRYELFRVNHSVLLYPLQIIYQNVSIQIPNEATFRDQLQKILGSDTTKRLINALLAQIPR